MDNVEGSSFRSKDDVDSGKHRTATGGFLFQTGPDKGRLSRVKNGN